MVAARIQFRRVNGYRQLPALPARSNSTSATNPTSHTAQHP
jgi:hypothetical protein